MTVKELIDKLREYPMESDLDVRRIAGGDKIILVVKNQELDPVFQFPASEIKEGWR
jgi:hypothetical protein